MPLQTKKLAFKLHIDQGPESLLSPERQAAAKPAGKRSRRSEPVFTTTADQADEEEEESEPETDEERMQEASDKEGAGEDDEDDQVRGRHGHHHYYSHSLAQQPHEPNGSLTDPPLFTC